MLTKVNATQADEQHIFVGIDVHKKQYLVQVLGEYDNIGPCFSQEASPEILLRHFNRNYPDAHIHCVYEAGFSGFSLYRYLTKAGIDCSVVHPADVPTTDKDKRTKSDKVDAKKLALHLRSNALAGIHVPAEHFIALRNLVRTRKRLVKSQTRYKNQIRHFLFFNGIQTPQEFSGSWSTRFMEWLHELPFSKTNRWALDGYLNLLGDCQQTLKDLQRKMVQISKESQYNKQLCLLRTVPGIGLTSAFTLLSEIGEMRRFKTQGQLFSYVGLVPHLHASGESEYVGRMTIRGNRWLKSIIIECAWSAISKDPALFSCYNHYKKRMKANKAIIRIAKKLLSRIRRVMLTGEPYQMAIN